jgi:hypothetical protein
MRRSMRVPTLSLRWGTSVFAPTPSLWPYPTVCEQSKAEVGTSDPNPSSDPA